MPQAVSDFLSNAPEQIEQAARAVGRSAVTRKVFLAIYTGKERIKAVGTLAKSTKLTRKQVLTAGKRLHNRHIVHQTKKAGDTAYEKIDSFYANKSKILGYAGNNKKLATLQTKRNISVKIRGVVQLPTRLAKNEQITVDDIDSFKRIRSVTADNHLPKTISEKKFKHGVRKILNEPGKFTDWGGERNDLYTTRVKIKGKRYPAAFAFKGPGKTGKLVPGKMGKNGDQDSTTFPKRC
jgi:hypothetical protein